MRNVLENNPLAELWRDADNLLDYTIALWITALGILAVSGILTLIYQLFTDPASFSNATFGIFDTLGS
jgi:hypothetical protein